MKIALVRHGQTDWNIQRRYQGWQGLALNGVGLAQAVEAAQRVQDVGNRIGANWGWLASSDAHRAIQTAQIIGSALGLTLGEQLPGLVERGFGVAEGMLISEARNRWPERDYPGGETIDKVLDRSLLAVDQLAAAHLGMDGVIVSHGTVLRLIQAELTGIDPGSLPNGTIVALDGTPGDWQVVLTEFGAPPIPDIP